MKLVFFCDLCVSLLFSHDVWEEKASIWSVGIINTLSSQMEIKMSKFCFWMKLLRSIFQKTTKYS